MLALFALALQFTLAFGHVHHEPATTAGMAAANPGPSHDDDGGLGERCDICAVIHLAASSLTPEAPVLVLPVRIAAPHVANFMGEPHVAAPPRLYRARAPPQA